MNSHFPMTHDTCDVIRDKNFQFCNNLLFFFMPYTNDQSFSMWQMIAFHTVLGTGTIRFSQVHSFERDLLFCIEDNHLFDIVA